MTFKFKFGDRVKVVGAFGDGKDMVESQIGNTGIVEEIRPGDMPYRVLLAGDGTEWSRRFQFYARELKRLPKVAKKGGGK